ncbi:MAG: hypothetical protein Q8N96_16370 [Methylovulum sp.]|nr:hypothetical protein [Methylovulum sp.]
MTTINTLKPTAFLVLVISLVTLNIANAAPREGGGNTKIINKLQGMVNDITTERDLLKTESAKVTAELETVKGQVTQEKEAAALLAEKLNADLGTQKASHDEIQARLDNTTAKLREVIEKYNALNKSKNELSAEHIGLQNNQQLTASELKVCESKNVKMFEGAKEIIEAYHHCQNKGIVDALIDSEPFSQIKNIEFETIIQEYEDKLNKQKYHGNPNAGSSIPAVSKPASAAPTAQPSAVKK